MFPTVETDSKMVPKCSCLQVSMPLCNLLPTSAGGTWDLLLGHDATPVIRYLRTQLQSSEHTPSTAFLARVLS